MTGIIALITRDRNKTPGRAKPERFVAGAILQTDIFSHRKARPFIECSPRLRLMKHGLDLHNIYPAELCVSFHMLAIYHAALWIYID